MAAMRDNPDLALKQANVSFETNVYLLMTSTFP
jgi:hypothetical protein